MCVWGGGNVVGVCKSVGVHGGNMSVYMCVCVCVCVCVCMHVGCT